MFMLERGLEKRWRRARIDDLPGLPQRFPLMLVIVRDQMPAGIAPAGKLAYFMAGFEDEFEGLIGGGGKIAGVEVAPKVQMALLAFQVGGLGGRGLSRAWAGMTQLALSIYAETRRTGDRWGLVPLRGPRNSRNTCDASRSR